ncbi:MAG: gamma carbonic anhydrase family protein [Nitrospinota bacterium]
MIKPYNGIFPTIHPSAFVEESASIIGDVVIEEESGIWFRAVVRGDVNSIRIGKRTNIQDGSVLHVDHARFGMKLGNDITVGHGVILHGCQIGSNSLVGMGSIIMDGAQIGTNVMVGAGALITQNFVVPDGVLVVGSPAKVKRGLTAHEKKEIQQSARNYVNYFKDYLPGKQ